MPELDPPSFDPLAGVGRDRYSPGAVLLSDQIEYYIDKLRPPLLTNPHNERISTSELLGSLDAASYKLRLGNKAHVGGERVDISDGRPLLIPPHQVAIVTTHEQINLPRFLIARWNLRVKWVYEGLLWTGGPQVDPGWQGHLFCPIYNLAERQIVIPHKEPVFTMDFTRTTYYQKVKTSSYGYVSKNHKGARDKTLQGHDIHRLRSAPFEALRQLSGLDTRVNSFNTFTFLVLAIMIAAIGVIASFGVGGSTSSPDSNENGAGLLVLTIIALVFGLSGVIVGVIAMVGTLGPGFVVRRPRRQFALASLCGTALLAVGSGVIGYSATSELSDWLRVVICAPAILMVLMGISVLVYVWCQVTKPR